MTRLRSILFECHGYRGKESYERRRAVEEHVMGRIEGECRIESVAMRELCVEKNAVQPAVEAVYSGGDCRKLVPRVDGALLEMGLVAARALVSTVAPRAGGAAAAAGAGGAAGPARPRSGGAGAAAGLLAGTLLGAALGALAGKAAEERTLGFIYTKQSGRWHAKRFPRQHG